MGFTGGTGALNPTANNIEIDNSSATAFRVEQEGVHDDVLLVDNSTGSVRMGGYQNEYADTPNVGTVKTYKPVRIRPWRQTSGGTDRLGIEDLLVVDCRPGSEYADISSSNTWGNKVALFYNPTGSFVANGAACYLDAGGHFSSGMSVNVVGRPNNVNTETGFLYYAAFYQADGTTQIGAMITAYCDVNDPTVIINAGHTGLTGSYPLLIGRSDAGTAQDRTADVGVFAMEKDGKMWWSSAGTAVVAGQLPSANAGFTVNLYAPLDNQLKTDDQFIATDGVTTKVVSGAGTTTVTDGNFTATPNNGTLVVIRNTTDSSVRIGARAGGSWKYATLT